jgi:hypothetical protein
MNNNNNNDFDSNKLLKQVLEVPTNSLLLQYISSNKTSYEEISRILTLPSQLLGNMITLLLVLLL